MLIYWLMFAFPAAFALFEKPAVDGRSRFDFLWMFATVALVLLVGLRWETGGDWGNYDRMVEAAIWERTSYAAFGDPGFLLLTKIAATTRFGMLLVTLVSGVVMSAALARFSLEQPRPWLCLAVAIPYIVVVMGMGYIRQGIAVSIFMIALARLRDGAAVRYSLWIVLAAMFHSTALVLLPLVIVITRANLVARAGIAVITTTVFGYAMYSSRAEQLVTNYVDAQMASSGAVIRLVMTALPAALLLVFRDRFALKGAERSVWTLLSIGAITGLLLLLVFPSSTVIDRTALYLLPVQCFVYARLPDVLTSSTRAARLTVALILALYVASFFVWLNYAVNVNYWLPYRFYPLENSVCLEC
jgi:hypothetical protein